MPRIPRRRKTAKGNADSQNQNGAAGAKAPGGDGKGDDPMEGMPVSPEPEPLDPSEAKQYENMRCSMNQNMNRYQSSDLPTISQFSIPNVDNTAIKKVVLHIQHTRDKQEQMFFQHEADGERKAREKREAKMLYETDVARKQEILTAIKKLKEQKEKSEQNKHELFAEMRKSLSSSQVQAITDCSMLPNYAPPLGQMSQTIGPLGPSMIPAAFPQSYGPFSNPPPAPVTFAAPLDPHPRMPGQASHGVLQTPLTNINYLHQHQSSPRPTGSVGVLSNTRIPNTGAPISAPFSTKYPSSVLGSSPVAHHLHSSLTNSAVSSPQYTGVLSGPVAQPQYIPMEPSGSVGVISGAPARSRALMVGPTGAGPPPVPHIKPGPSFFE